MRRILLMVLLTLSPMSALAQTSPETIEYYGIDAIGSIRIVFGVDGSVLARQDYGPFGIPLLPAPQMPSEQFGGNTTDDESQQGYFHARQLLARTGRFGAADPIYDGIFEPQRWNRYSYALNNPLSMADPSGLLAAPNAALCTSQIREINPNDWHCQSAFWDVWATMNFGFGVSWQGNGGTNVGGPGPGRPAPGPSSDPGGNPSPSPGPTPGPNPDPPPNQGPTPPKKTGDETTRPSWTSELLRCASDHYGLTALTAMTAAASAPVISKETLKMPILPGASARTNAISLLGHYVPIRAPFRVAGTRNVLRMLGRVAPYATIGLAAYDAYSIGSCVAQ